MKKVLGIIFLSMASFVLIGLLFGKMGTKEDIPPAMFSIFLNYVIGLILVFSAKKDYKKKIEQQIEYKKRLKQKEVRLNEELEQKFEEVNKLNENIKELENLNIIEVNDFKGLIIENEKRIIEKGGENQLLLFLKLHTFLKEYQNRIVKDKEELSKLIDVDSLKERIINDSKRDELEKLHENLQSNLAELEGKKPIGFDANLKSLFKNGSMLKISMEDEIRTLEFYKNISNVMLIFYLNDKKIRYYDIYEAFEKLGVFDSTWQKNVLNKLDRIEIRLMQINNQLTELNQNFILLAESSQILVEELKELNSNLSTNNMLQAITAYQTWRINRNTK